MTKSSFAGLVILVTVVLMIGGLVFTDTFITETGTAVAMGVVVVWHLR